MPQKLILSRDAERLLAIIVHTTNAQQRTRRALIASGSFTPATLFDTAVHELLDNGYVQQTGVYYEATHSGETFAHALEPQKPGAAVPGTTAPGIAAPARSEDNASPPARPKPQAANAQDKATAPNPKAVVATTQLEDMDTQKMEPILALPLSHLLRSHKIASAEDREHTRRGIVHAHPVYFMLAFDQHRYALPVPILNTDVLGRGRDADIRVKNDSAISRAHCRFTVQFDKSGTARLYLEDLNSRCGTFLGAEKIAQGKPIWVKHGNRITVGSTILIVTMIPY